MDYDGEICNKRTLPGIQKIKEKIKQALDSNQNLTIDRTGVKVLTPSYIDELIPQFNIDYGKDKVSKLIQFSPPLEGFLAEQVERGTNLRLKSN